MRQTQAFKELSLRVGSEVITLPVLKVSLWEDTDEEGFVMEWGYTYYTHHGRVITRMTHGGEEVLHAHLDWEALGLPAPSKEPKGGVSHEEPVHA